MLAAFGACSQKWNLAYLNHWKPRHESDHLVAGGAYAEGLEVMRHKYYIDHASKEDALAYGITAAIQKYGDHTPTTEHKTLDRVIAAIAFYAKTYPLDKDEWKPVTIEGRPGIEFNFVIPFYHPEYGEILHPVSGDPILYTGRSDAIVSNAEQYVYHLDDKTCTQLGASWLNQWRLRSQFTGYYWGALQYGIKTLGTIVRGNCFYRAIRPETGDIYVCQQVISSRTIHDVNIWLTTTYRRIERAIKQWKSGEFEFSLGDACNAYGGCQFQKICTSKYPDRWLASEFEQRVWDPLERTTKTTGEKRRSGTGN